MGKGKQQQPTGSNDKEDGGDELAGSTLEDYFASHKVSGHVSQHLLNIPTENNVMAAEKIDDGKGARNLEVSERKSEQKNYEDDYESEPSSPKAEPPSKVAGMSLSDYLHVKEDDSAVAQEKFSKAGSLRVLAPQLAATAKKPAPISDVSGMSLDHYLGASHSDENGHTGADKKPSPQVKRSGSKSKQILPQAKATQQPFSVKGNGFIHGSHPNSSTQNVSSDDEETPFQRRQKRKDKAKAKQQRNAGGVSKAILMAEGPTIVSVRDREKRKSSLNEPAHSHHPGHHGSHSSTSNFQPPLPKLGVSPSVHSLSHKDHDAEGDKADKLPPL
ncbi:hypothetical protein PC121_g4645 [Phytophthora cactorum]|nr:hypothetical protein PC120_g2661 [Phytophthora cactorum]KAG3087312.1 hypothetical protein PC121_g4645 [Phytophthora cactorum]KAG4058176.1 hypothetical protein PC123_g6857 [Phytophthora cactorum]